MTQKLKFMSPVVEVSSSVPGIKFAVVEVTPAIALEWLKRNFSRNRSLNKAAVARYAREMKAGAWRLSHQSIAFDSSGTLIDGQHRLRAVVESGCTVAFLVSHYEGLATSLEVIDTGTVRPLASVMEIRGTVDKGTGASVSAVLNALANLISGAIRRQLSTPDMERLYAAHREGIDFGAQLSRSHKITAAFGAAAAYTYPICPQRIESLFVQAAKNDGLSIYSGAWHLNRLLRLGSQTHAQRLDNSQAAVKCAMLHMKDREVKLLKVAVEGSLDGMAWAEKERVKLGLFTGMWADEASP